MASLKHPILLIFVTLNYLFLCVESQVCSSSDELNWLTDYFIFLLNQLIN